MPELIDPAIVDIETLTTLLIRLVGLGLLAVSFIWGIGNVWRNWQSLHPSFVGLFLRRQTTHTNVLAVAGCLLMLLAGPLAEMLSSGLG